MRGQLPAALAAAALLGAGVACGENVFGPGGVEAPRQGSVSAFIRDEPTGGLAPAPPGASALPPAAAALQFTGIVDVRAQVLVSRDGESFVSLGGPREVSIPLRSAAADTEVHRQAQVPTGTFTVVRVVLEGGTALIRRESVVDGQILATDRTLVLGGDDGTAVADGSLEFQVTADGLVEILVALDSEAWVSSATVDAGVVSDELLRQAIRFRLR